MTIYQQIIFLMKLIISYCKLVFLKWVAMSGGQLLEIWLLDTFGRKSIARHKIYQLLESSWARINWIRAVDTFSSATYKLEKSIFYL